MTTKVLAIILEGFKNKLLEHFKQKGDLSPFCLYKGVVKGLFFKPC